MKGSLITTDTAQLPTAVVRPSKESLMRTLQNFREIIRRIEGTAWREKLQESHRLYNLKPYNIERLTPKKVLELYE